MNAIERSERADRLARFSRALEALGPVLVAVMMIPSAAMALFLGLATGFGMGAGEGWGVPLMHAVRVVLFVVIVFVVMGPLMLPSGRGLASLQRLLLLPVSHRSLFAGEVLGGLSAPWTLLASIAIVMIPVGALIAGNFLMAAIAALAAVAVIATLLALGALFGALLHVLMRDRQRGEWFVVLAFTLLPLAAMAPAFLAGTSASREGSEWEKAFEARMEEMLEQPASGALALFPGELFVASAARAAGMSPGAVMMPLIGLGIAAAGATAGGWALWKRTIDRGGISRRPKSQTAGAAAPSALRTMRSVPRALAFTFLQHVTRTARGRTIVLPSLIMSLVLAVLVGWQGGLKLGDIPLRDGFSVAVFGIVLAFLSVVQLWMNQFAIDRAGLTMLSLQPVTTSQILRGKMTGAALLIAGLSLLPIVAGLIIGARVHPVYWLVLLMGGAAAFMALAPFAVLLSALFPKHVDMSSIGQKSNAHPAAGLLGGLFVFASGAPAVAAAVIGFRMMHSAIAALGLVAAWVVIALVIHVIFWRIAVATFERRRESLIAVATGR
jgi:hypothetical protein